MTTNDTNGRLGGVVVGFDGSDQAREAVFWAVGEAVRRDRPLLITQAHLVPVTTVGHAWGPLAAPAWGANASLWDQAYLFDDERVRRHNERTLAALAEECGARAPELTVSTVLEDGPPRTVLSATAVTVDADMLVVGAALVVGTRGRGAVRRALLGSVSHAALYHASCPVAIVPSPEVVSD